MPILRFPPLPVKGGRVACPACYGRGHIPTREGNPTCERCNGDREVIEWPPDEPEPEPSQQTFFAYSGGSLLEVGASLKPFVDHLCAAWEDDKRDDVGPDDVAIWVERPDRPLSLCAVLWRGLSGRASVTYL